MVSAFLFVGSNNRFIFTKLQEDVVLDENLIFVVNVVPLQRAFH